jgi:diguanylate cyclase (GGDEF)-like protein
VTAGPRETAGVTTRLIVEYVRQRAGEQAVPLLLEAAGDPRPVEVLLDERSWSTYDQKIALFQAAEDLTGDRQVAFHIGATVIEAQVAAPLKVMLTALGSPQQAIRSCARANGKFAANSIMRALEARPGHAVLTYQLDATSVPNRHDCLYTQGIISQATVLFGLPPASIQHAPFECQVEGAPRCTYTVDWPRWRTPLQRLWDRVWRRSSDTTAEVRALRTQLEDLQVTGMEIVSSPDLDGLLARIATRAFAAVRAQRYLLAVQLDGEHAPRVLSDGLTEEEAAGLAAEILRSEPVRAGNRLIVDVRSANRSFGRLAALLPERLDFLPSEQHLLEAYAGLAAAALESTTALADARRRQRVSDTLVDLARAIAAVDTLGEAGLAIVRAVPPVIGATRASMLLWDAEEAALIKLATHGFTGELGAQADALRVDWSNTPELQRMIATPRPVLYRRGATADPFIDAQIERFDAAAVAVAPIVVRGQFVGVIFANWATATGGPVEDDSLLRGLTSLADQAGLAITSIRMLDSIRHQATHDALTGLANRALFHSQLSTALAAARREGTTVSVCFLDLDGFKGVNDTYGHAAGDAVLVEVGARIRGCVRASDTVARLSGDEFGIILSGGATDASAVADKLVAAVAQPFSVGVAAIAIGVSVGIAISPDHGDSPEDLLNHADSAMYEAKATGSTHRVYAAG